MNKPVDNGVCVLALATVAPLLQELNPKENPWTTAALKIVIARATTRQILLVLLEHRRGSLVEDDRRGNIIARCWYVSVFLSVIGTAIYCPISSRDDAIELLKG
jgi:hypothetical protein